MLGNRIKWIGDLWLVNLTGDFNQVVIAGEALSGNYTPENQFVYKSDNLVEENNLNPEKFYNICSVLKYFFLNYILHYT